MTEPGRKDEGAVAPSRPSTQKPITRSHAEWKGGLLFEAGADGRTHRIDGDSKQAPSPVETLLSSLGTCAASDVVEILTKQRTPPAKLAIDVVATRRAEFPRRVMQLAVTFTIDGDRLERPKVERAIALSVEKYCTVAASLAGDITLDTVLVLNGAAGDSVTQPMFSAGYP